MIRVFVGFDAHEHVAYHVLCHSIHRRTTQPVSITPLKIGQLGDLMWRERNPLQSTEFSFSRFLTPYLCGFEGWAIFMDCDMLALDDFANLWNLRDDNYAIQVVKNEHDPSTDTKFLGQVQTKYEKKNWSSVIMFNNAKCTALTPDYVNTASGLELHQFKWLGNDDLIGALPARWNHLVDEHTPIDNPGVLHYTLGGPYFDDYKDCGYAQEWLDEFEDMKTAG